MFDAPINTNQSNLGRVLSAGLPVLLAFWRRDCSPCEQLMPALEHLARAYAGRALVVKINADDELALLSRYGVTHLPSIVFIKDGSNLATASGAANEADLKAWLDHLTGGGPRPAVPGGPSIALASAAGGQPQPGPAPERAANRGSSTGKPVVLTDESFDMAVSTSALPVMVDFWAVWCGPCRMVAPVVEQMAQEFAGRAVLAKLNVDENPIIASRYGIMSIPTLLIFRDGQIVDRIVGAQPAQVLKQRLLKQVR